MQRFLGIYVKHPLPGQVKTRLAASVGAEAAANLYRAFLADLITRFRKTGDRRFLCFSPNTPAAAGWFAEFAGSDYELWPQPAGSLEPRLENFFRFAGGQGSGGTVVIGSDSPTLPPEYVHQAFEYLQSQDCVIGPAMDGGYYLLGLRKALPIFSAIAWSTPEVLSQTVARLSRCDASLGLLPAWYDVDTVEDLHHLTGHVQALAYADDPLANTLKETQKALDDLRGCGFVPSALGGEG